jgi:hypothetical protein
MLPGAVAGTLLENITGSAAEAFVYVFAAFVVFPLLVGAVCWVRSRRRNG